jgi:hypothetical protein
MKARQTTNTNTTREELPVTKISSHKILSARAMSDGTPMANIEINGIRIYGCKVMARKSDGEAFLAWPSAKGKDGKYYNVAYAKLDPEAQEMIIGDIYKILDANQG